MFFKYIQSARVGYWELSGLYEHYRKTGEGPILAHTECDFLLPLFYPGEIRIDSRMAWIRNSSFSLRHEIFDQDGKMVARAMDVIVMYDFNKEKKMPFPELFRDRIEVFEI